MNYELIKKIRKLLRLANQGGPESFLAKARASELMEKHQITVTLDDVIRRPISGVAGVFWREQLLLTITRRQCCRMLQSTRDDGTVFVAGERDDVEEAVDVYKRIAADLAVRCKAKWEMHIAPNEQGVRPPECFSHPDVIAAWFGFYMPPAVQSVVKRLGAPPEKKAPDPTPPVGPQPVSREKPVDPEAEKNQTYAHLEKLANIIGPQQAYSLFNSSRMNGATDGELVYVIPRSLKLLEAGTPPHPKSWIRRKYDQLMG